MREKITELINDKAVDLEIFYKFYREKGGTLDAANFIELFSLYIKGKNILDIYDNMIREFNIFILLTEEGALVKAF